MHPDIPTGRRRLPDEDPVGGLQRTSTARHKRSCAHALCRRTPNLTLASPLTYKAKAVSQHAERPCCEASVAVAVVQVWVVQPPGDESNVLFSNFRPLHTTTTTTERVASRTPCSSQGHHGPARGTTQNPEQAPHK